MSGSSSKVRVATEVSEMRDESYNVSEGNEAIDSCILQSALPFVLIHTGTGLSGLA